MRAHLATCALLLCSGSVLAAPPGVRVEEPPVSAWLDLDLHPERFSLWQGEAQVVPGEGPGRSRFVYAGRGPELLVVTPARPRLVVAPRAPGWLELRVDGRAVHTAHSLGAPETITLDVSAGTHRLSFFGALPRWVKVVPAGQSPGHDEPPLADGFGRALASGYRLETTGALPESGTFLAEVAGRNAVVEARVVCASGAERKRHRLLFGSRLRVPLGRCAGEVGTLALEAVEGEVTVAALRVAAPPPPSVRPPQPRGAIVWVIDTLRADRMPSDGQDRLGTVPGAAALAADATVHTRAYAASNWTKPSTATLLTGWMPWSHGAITHDAVLSDRVPLLPQRLPEHTRTAAFVANGYVSERFGFARGWDEFHETWLRGRGRGAEIATDALAWLDALGPTEPFFLYLHTTEPHFPYDPSQEVLAQTLGADAEVVDVSDPLLLRRIERGELALTPRQRRGLVAQYDAEVRAHDGDLAAFLSGLRERGLLDEALVVVTADHGEELFDHGSVNHGGERLHEELVRIPLIVRWPGGGARTDARPMGHHDVHATVLQALLGALPPAVHGRPLAEPDDAPRWAVTSYGRNRYAVIAHGHKLTLVLRGEGAEGRLYDLERDPGEARDRLEGGLRVAAELAALLMLRLAETEVSMEPPPEVAIDGAVEEQLRALGYVE